MSLRAKIAGDYHPGGEARASSQNSVAFCLILDAVLSPCLKDLFPEGVFAAELREPGSVSWLLPAEALCVAGAVSERAQEFAAGRICARRLLKECGIRDFPLTAAADRQPVWPDGLLGSITHTTGFCAAVLARKAHIFAIGIDSEVAGGVKQELWNKICTPGEREWLHSLPQADRWLAVTLIFSAKEAFYKCQYPITRERLKFQDASIEPLQWNDRHGEFIVKTSQRIAFAEHAALPVTGRYRFHEQFISTGIALRASAAQ